ncbi:hypothetical protein IQ06DRAFT_367123 [Phaeosphaeriaceae sp. SRC1lsM3a]|nr:hypothetical protein IQ06DRAFT_367123 [Stagonospora sp. SRC1lsM3a]
MSPKSQALPSPPSQNENGGKITPKERGCFQCSRRRIICDKGEPSCGKCIKKGIECSGLNRIRFTGSVARRGKFKNLPIPNIQDGETQNLPNSTTFTGVRWKNEKKAKSRTAQNLALLQSIVQLKPVRYVTLPINKRISITSPQEFENDVEDIVRVVDDITTLQTYPTTMNIQPWIAPLTAEARMLFSYFSEAVAPVMVVLDTNMNGYREVILPMAMEDEVLRRAVGVVAAQHLSRERPEMRDAAEAGRAAIISRLRNDSLSATPDQVFNISTWATLIVLLVGETVTGSADFGFLVHMLLCLSSSSSMEDQSTTVKRFLRTQTAMFEALSLPLLGEHDGVPVVQGSFKRWQNWLTADNFPIGSENHRIVDKIRLCFASACDIYLRRATCDNANAPLSTMPHYDEIQTSAIQHLIEHVSQISPGTPGAHALVWPCFVAGAEATDPGQRTFLVNYMDSIYGRTKFRNIPAAIQSLERLWASKGRRWTQCLPEISQVLVM